MANDRAAHHEHRVRKSMPGAAQLVWVDDGAYLFGEHGASSNNPGRLEFVAEDGRNRPSEVVIRRKIRSHAMRNATTRKDVRIRGKKGQAAASAEKESSETSPSESIMDAVIWKQDPQSEGVEPYGDLPVVVNKHLKRLLYHYTTVFLASSAAMTPRHEFMPFATKDLALFHTTMFLSAAHLILLDPTFPILELFHHRGQSLHCISQRLGDSKQRSTDATICAIACFAQLEVCADSVTGTVEGVNAHMTGLRQLVNMRGGMPAFSANPFLSRLLLWLDLMSSIRLQSSPILQPSRQIGNETPTSMATPLPTSRTPSPIAKRELNLTPPPSPIATHNPYEEATAISTGLKYLSALKAEAETSHNSHFLDDIYFSDKVAIVERRAHFLKAPENLYGLEYDAPLFRAFGQAALIYIYAVHRDFPDGNALHLDLQQQLRYTLQEADLRTASAMYPEMLVWIVIVGGSVNGITDAKLWFVDAMARLCRQLRIEPSEESVLGAIGDFPWAECKSANGRSIFWRELEHGRKKRSIQ